MREPFKRRVARFAGLTKARLEHLIALTIVVASCMGPPSTVSTRDGITIELQLDRAKAMIGERVTATVHVANQSDQVIYRDYGVEMPGITPDPRCSPVASIVAIEPDTYPNYDEVGPDRQFAPAGMEPDLGCPAYLVPQAFPPGSDVTEQMEWDVVTETDTPSVVIRATFGYWPTLDSERTPLEAETVLVVDR